MKRMKFSDNFIFERMTDLADERDELMRASPGFVDGIKSERRQVDGVDIFTMRVQNAAGERKSGRKIGKYVTVNVGSTNFYDTATFERVCTVFAAVIREFLQEAAVSGGCYLLVGLGNPRITADSIGAETVDSFIVTRHLKESSPQLFQKFGFSESAAIVPDVFGNTGVESAEIIKGVVDDIRPSCVIAIDSLTSRRLSRLSSTVQICDTGICPGSGVGNSRAEISKETLGVPVLAIGVPTVVNAATLVADILGECGIGKDSLGDAVKRRIAAQLGGDCYVSPKDSGETVKSISRFIGYALNAAIHRDISFSEMQDFL